MTKHHFFVIFWSFFSPDGFFQFGRVIGDQIPWGSEGRGRAVAGGGGRARLGHSLSLSLSVSQSFPCIFVFLFSSLFSSRLNGRLRMKIQSNSIAVEEVVDCHNLNGIKFSANWGKWGGTNPSRGKHDKWRVKNMVWDVKKIQNVYTLCSGKARAPARRQRGKGGK